MDRKLTTQKDITINGKESYRQPEFIHIKYGAEYKLKEESQQSNNSTESFKWTISTSNDTKI